MKTININENPLKIGMRFKSYYEIFSFLGYSDSNCKSTMKRRAFYYGEFQWDQNTSELVTIKVFNDIKPFKIKGYQYELGEIITINMDDYIVLDRYVGRIFNMSFNGNIYICRRISDKVEIDISESEINAKKFFYHRKEIENPLIEKQIDNNKLTDDKPQNMDHISYPNKFVRNLLNQLGIEYIPEKTFSWSNKKRYDIYLINQNIIIENHGNQHYEDCEYFSTTLKETQENDVYKERLAYNNGINSYIVIDCRRSSLSYIKKSIMNSILPQILKFQDSDIDWNKCHYEAINNSELRKICSYYVEENNITVLANVMHHDRKYIRNCLEIGAELGYCDYIRGKNGTSDIGESKTKPIFCQEDNIYFRDKFECEKYYEKIIPKFKWRSLVASINNKREYKSKHFNYITRIEFNKQKDINVSMVIGDYFKERYLEK